MPKNLEASNDDGNFDSHDPEFYAIYLLLILISAPIAVFSMFCALFNPVGWLLMGITGPLVTLTGGIMKGWSTYGPTMTINLIWPLTLVPLHLISSQGLKWRFWQYLLLCVACNLLMAFLVLRFDLGFQ